MSLQSLLNDDCINKLPKIKNLINNAEAFEAAQMEQRVLRDAMNTNTAIDDMTPQKIEQFQNNEIEIFKNFGWIR